jgi:hypothetical protein
MFKWNKWHLALMAYLSPSIDSALPYGFAQALANSNNVGGTASAAAIAAELAKINPSLIKSAPRSTAYTPNPYTARQLAQFQPQQGLLSAQNPIYQQYLTKMGQYGAGAGKTAPSQGSK